MTIRKVTHSSLKVKSFLKKENIVSLGLPAHLQNFINGLTQLQMRILKEFFYLATKSTVACSEDGLVGFETTYGFISNRVNCHYKTVQNLVSKLRDAGLLESRSSIKKPNIYRFIQFLKKKWVRNRLYQLLTPVVFISTCLLTGTTRTTDREEYPHISYKVYKYKKEIEEIVRFARRKKEKQMNKKSPHNEIGNFQKPYQQTRADVLEKKYLNRPEYKKFDPKTLEVEKEDRTIWEKFFNYYTNANPMFKKMNPFRREFDKAVDDMIKDSNVDRKIFVMRLYDIYKAKQCQKV